jgi:uncharacterized protein YaaN involved in tellurite resistance
MLTTGKEVHSRLKFSIDGKRCLVTNSGDGAISVYEQQKANQKRYGFMVKKVKLLEEYFIIHTRQRYFDASMDYMLLLLTLMQIKLIVTNHLLC